MGVSESKMKERRVYPRQSYRRVGIHICAKVAQALAVGMVYCKMLNVRSSGFYPILIEVCDCREARMPCRTMIALYGELIRGSC